MRTGRILIIVHQKTSTPGHVGALLAERGYELDRCCPCHDGTLPETLDDHDGVVIFGGPMSANDDATLDGIRQELDFIPKVLDAEKPFLGICLGAVKPICLKLQLSLLTKSLPVCNGRPARPTRAGLSRAVLLFG